MEKSEVKKPSAPEAFFSAPEAPEGARSTYPATDGQSTSIADKKGGVNNPAT
jgi:hypothetical protein